LSRSGFATHGGIPRSPAEKINKPAERAGNAAAVDKKYTVACRRCAIKVEGDTAPKKWEGNGPLDDKSRISGGRIAVEQNIAAFPRADAGTLNSKTAVPCT